jgi:TPR repeat protein
MIFKLKMYFLFIACLFMAGCADLHRAESDFQQGNYATAKKQWEVLADRNFPRAYVGLGKLAELDNGESTDLALSYYQHAYNSGYSPASHYIGKFYYKHHQNQKELERASQWIIQSAKQGNRNAYMIYADMQMSGAGVIQNSQSALSIFENLSEHGYASATRKLGQLYEKGLNVTKDNVKAFDYFKLAVEQGSVESELDVARFYEQGITGDNNWPYAKNIFIRHAKSGNTKAAYLLAQALERRALMAGDAMPEEAKYWYQAAADQGHLQAQFILLDMTLDKDSSSQKTEAMIAELRTLSEQGMNQASFRLGTIYQQENGISEQALHYYQKAFLQGSNKSVTTLANLYRQGIGLNDAAIKAQYEKIARTGRVEAAFLLGVTYEMLPDQKQALYWYHHAASKNYSKSFPALVRIYGAAGNVVESNQWLLKAARAGDEKAMLQYGEALFDGRSIRADKTQGLAYVLAAARLRVGGAVTKSLSMMGLLKDAKQIELANQQSKQILASALKAKVKRGMKIKSR